MIQDDLAELFRYVDRYGMPHHTVKRHGNFADAVLVPIPSELLQSLRAEIAPKDCSCTFHVCADCGKQIGKGKTCESQKALALSFEQEYLLCAGCAEHKRIRDEG